MPRSKPDGALSGLLERHARFWRHEPADRPLIRVGEYAPLQLNLDVPLRGGRWASEGDRIVPDDLDLERMLEQWPPPDSAVDGDYLRAVAPYGLCWMEGVIGARVYAASGSIWSDPAPFDWGGVPRLRSRLGEGNPWYGKLREYLARLAERAAGRVPVTHPLMRGPSDMAEALVGSEELVLALHDHPAELEALLTTCADAFVQVGRAVAELAPLFHDGHVSYGIWAPGTAIGLQADHASLLSPRAYRERFAHHERRICEAFDYSIFHLHSCNVHILDVLLDLEPLDAVQVSLDPWPSGPRLATLLPDLRRIQPAGKSLLITGGPVSREELEEALATLPATGLALSVQIGSTWD